MTPPRHTLRPPRLCPSCDFLTRQTVCPRCRADLVTTGDQARAAAGAAKTRADAWSKTPNADALGASAAKKKGPS